MTQIPENLTQMEYAIRILEAYKKGGIADTGARTSLDGFNQALKVLRTLARVGDGIDVVSRLEIAFQEFAFTHLNCQTFTVQKCTECGKNHGDTLMIKVKDNGTERFWALCPVLNQPMYYFEDN